MGGEQPPLEAGIVHPGADALRLARAAFACRVDAFTGREALRQGADVDAAAQHRGVGAGDDDGILLAADLADRGVEHVLQARRRRQRPAAEHDEAVMIAGIGFAEHRREVRAGDVGKAHLVHDADEAGA